MNSYEEAKDYFDIIYLHEWNGRPFYWGKVDKSKFGGASKFVGDRRLNARYNPGYKHWIEGCLRHGACLYIGQIEERGEYSLDEIEGFLIAKYPSEMNRRVRAPLTLQQVDHEGEVPISVKGGSNAL